MLITLTADSHCQPCEKTILRLLPVEQLGSNNVDYTFFLHRFSDLIKMSLHGSLASFGSLTDDNYEERWDTSFADFYWQGFTHIDEPLPYPDALVPIRIGVTSIQIKPSRCMPSK